MKWVTRKKVRVNRTATAWLIRRFIDPGATFLFVEAEQVSEVQRREGATGFDAPGAIYPHIARLRALGKTRSLLSDVRAQRKGTLQLLPLTRHQQPASRATKGNLHRDEKLGDSVLLTMEVWAS